MAENLSVVMTADMPTFLLCTQDMVTANQAYAWANREGAAEEVHRGTQPHQPRRCH